MLAPSSFTRMSHKAPWSARYRPDLARSGQLSGLAARVAQTGCAHKCRPCPSPLPPLPDALLPAIGPAQKPSPSGKCSCLSLLQVLALPPVLRQKQDRVPAERPASRFQPAGSSAWLVCLARLSDSLPAHLAARPRSGEHQGSRKTARRARPASLACARSSDLVQGGSAGSPAGRPSRTRFVISNLKGGSTGAGSWGLCQTCTCCFQKKP